MDHHNDSNFKKFKQPKGSSELSGHKEASLNFTFDQIV
jgi:hypothetical protein